jgi:hypothetical protein
VATAQIHAGALSSASERAAHRRRAARQPAGWLLVEAESADGAHRLPGRLLDTSTGGLGMVLSERLAIGSVVRVSPAGSAYDGDTPPAWQGREAKVVHIAPLAGGSWRVGLSFTCAAPNGLQMWGTRLVLLVALALAVASYVVTQGASLTASAVVATVSLMLGIGAEWQHRCELRAFRRSQSPSASA